MKYFMILYCLQSLVHTQYLQHISIWVRHIQVAHGGQTGQQDSRMCWYVLTFENLYTMSWKEGISGEGEKKREELILAEGQLINAILYVFTFFFFFLDFFF